MKTLAIIVNYHASIFIEEAVESILNSPSVGPVQIVIVDNSADRDESDRLRHLIARRREVELIVSAENMGFGCACNAAFDRYDSDMVLLLNPDARLFDNCLIQLQHVLTSSGNIGAVGPQVFWDETHDYILPPSYPPILYWLQPVTSAGSPDSVINRIISFIWRCFAIKVWRANRPVRVQNLSGGNVLLKREAILKAGGLFDPRFFLYYEDTDMFIRLRQTGYHLLLVPGAKAVHYYDQCDQGNTSKKRELMAQSHRVFLQKHRNGMRCLPEKILTLFARIDHQPSPVHGLKTYYEPFALEIPLELKNEWLFEWSPNPDFIPAAGRFGNGPIMTFSEHHWRMLAPGAYYGRVGKPGCTGIRYSSWKWIKGQ